MFGNQVHNENEIDDDIVGEERNAILESKHASFYSICTSI